jgi:methylase of polypeptide subunit release factors
MANRPSNEPNCITKFGLNFARIPLHSNSNIFNRNALEIDWNEVIHATELSYIMGNPPFIGKKEQNAQQKAKF